MTSKFHRFNDTEKLQLIFDYIHKLNDTDDIETSLVMLADMGRDIVGAERCTIWLLDETGETLFSRVAHGVELLQVGASEGIVGACLQSKEPLIINEPYEDSRFRKDIDKKTGFTTTSIIVLPLYNSKNKIIGAIQALNKTSEDSNFTQEDEKILGVAASFSSKIVETLTLNRDLIESQKETIMLIGELCEGRSLETGKHTARVSLYSKVIAKKMGFSDADLVLISSAAALHDVGKLNIPDTILLKPGKLTDEEYKIMQTHSEMGYKMLSKSKGELLKISAIIAHEHHEKYNGRGYPRGLKGDEIHPFAKIVALSDVFDAITSKRCYKNAWELDESLDLIKKERGEHFDPEVVDAFFEVIDEIKEIYEVYKEVD